MNQIRARKEVLLRTSEEQRSALRRDASRLREAAGWIDAAMSLAGGLRSACRVMARVAETLKGPSTGPVPGILGKLSAGIAMARNLTGLWKAWRTSPRPDPDSTPSD